MHSYKQTNNRSIIFLICNMNLILIPHMLKQAIVQPETTYKVSAEKDENADHNSEAPRMKNKTTEQINSDRTVTTESRRKASYDEDEWEKISESYLVNNSEIKDAGEVIPKEEMNIKATALELQNSEIESNYVLNIQHLSLSSLPI